MLPAAARLRRGSDVITVIRRGSRGHAGPLTVHLRLAGPPSTPADPPAMMDQPAPPARVAFVIPKAVGGAVARNLVKRRLRQVVREHLHTLPSGADLVVRAAPPAATVSAADLALAFRAALGKSNRSAGAKR